MNTFIIINTTFDALHHWPDCPEDHSQSYLRNPHRHLFYIRMKWPVHHDDRDMEFIELKKRVDRRLLMHYAPVISEHIIRSANLKGMSCEMLAAWLLEQFPEASYCRVMEDNENGSEKFKYPE